MYRTVCNAIYGVHEEEEEEEEEEESPAGAYGRIPSTKARLFNLSCWISLQGYSIFCNEINIYRGSPQEEGHMRAILGPAITGFGGRVPLERRSHELFTRFIAFGQINYHPGQFHVQLL
jgi:hypothetical protein